MKADRNQPRLKAKNYLLEDLAASLKAEGLIHPIEIDEDNVIITGELRWLAAKKAGFKTIPCRMLTDLNPDERLTRQLVENLQRHDLPKMDIARSLEALKKSGLSIQQIADKLGKSRDWVVLHLTLLKAPVELQSAIEAGEISLESARKVADRPSTTQKQFVRKIIHDSLTRNEIRDLASAIDRKPEKAKEILAVPMKETGARRKIERIAPSPRTVITGRMEVGTLMLKLTDDLLRFLGKNSPAEIAPLYEKRVIKNIRDLQAELGAWERELA